MTAHLLDAGCLAFAALLVITAVLLVKATEEDDTAVTEEQCN